MGLSSNLKKYSGQLENENQEIKKNMKAFLNGLQLQESYFAKEHKNPEESMEADFKELHLSKQPLLKTVSSSSFKENKGLAKQLLECQETLFLVLTEKNNALQILISEIGDLKQVGLTVRQMIEKRESMYQDMIKKYEETRYELSKMVRSAKYAGNNEDELLNKIDELKISELETKLEVMQAQKNDLLGVIEKKKKKLKYMSQASASIELPLKKNQEVQFPDQEFLKEKADEEAKSKQVEQSILRLKSLNRPLPQILDNFEGESFGVEQSREWTSHLINQILTDKMHDDYSELQEKRTPLPMKKYVCQWFMSTFGTRSMAEIFLKDMIRSLHKDEPNLQRFKLFLSLAEIKFLEEPSIFKVTPETQENAKLMELWGLAIRPKSKIQKLTESLMGTPFTTSVIVKGAMLIDSAHDKNYNGLLPVIPALDCESSQKFYASKIAFSKARDILDQILFSYQAAEQLFTDDRLLSSDLLQPFILNPESEKAKIDLDLLLRIIAIVANRNYLRKLDHFATTLRIEKLAHKDQLYVHEFEKKIKIYFPEKSKNWIHFAFHHVNANCSLTHFTGYDVALALIPILFLPNGVSDYFQSGRSLSRKSVGSTQRAQTRMINVMNLNADIGLSSRSRSQNQPALKRSTTTEFKKHRTQRRSSELSRRSTTRGADVQAPALPKKDARGKLRLLQLTFDIVSPFVTQVFKLIEDNQSQSLKKSKERSEIPRKLSIFFEKAFPEKSKKLEQIFKMKQRKTSLGGYQISALRIQFAVKLKKLHEEIKSLTGKVGRSTGLLHLELEYSIEMAWRQLREILETVTIKGIGLMDFTTHETRLSETIQ